MRATRRSALLAAAAVTLCAGCGGAKTSASPAKDQAGAEAHATRLGGVRLVYQALAAAPGQAPPAAELRQASAILAGRLRDLRVIGWYVGGSGTQLVVVVPGMGIDAGRALVEQQGRLEFYDWEPNVVDRNGRVGRGNPAVTGGSSAGGPTAGVPL